MKAFAKDLHSDSAVDGLLCQGHLCSHNAQRAEPHLCESSWSVLEKVVVTFIAPIPFSQGTVWPPTTSLGNEVNHWFNQRNRQKETKQKNNALLCRISCLDEILFTLLSERISCTSNPTLYSLFSEAVLLFSEVSASVYISQGSEISRWCLCRRLANDLELAGLGLKGTETESSTLEVWLIVTIC